MSHQKLTSSFPTALAYIDSLPYRRNVAQRGDALELLGALPAACAALFDPQHRGVLDKLAFGNEGARQRERCRLPAMGEDYIDKSCREIARVLVPSAYCMRWVDTYGLCEAHHLRVADSLKCVDLIAWDNLRPRMGKRSRRRGDYLLVLQRPPVTASNWRDHGIPSRWVEKIDRRIHPHAKPIGLIERLIDERRTTRRSLPFAAESTDWFGVAHNAAFDHHILKHILAPLHGFPVIPIERMICTMALVSALALPGKLARAAKVLNLEHQKDSAGARIQRQMAKPRRPRKGEDPNGVYYYDDIERHAASDRSCMQDAETARDIYQCLPPLSPEEQRVWLLDQRINGRGFYLDHELAEAARKITNEAKLIINAELTKITKGEVKAFTQVARLTKWLKQFIEVDTLSKEAIEELLELDLPQNVRRVIELRSLGAQAAVAKVDALLQRRCPDGRVRGSFVYHAAGTGRWSSRGAQVHNLKRSLIEDIPKAVEIIGRGDFEHACQTYDNPLSVIGDLIRAMIRAAPGHTLIGCDFSGIEARVTAWLADEQSKLDVFRAYDAGRGPDPYIIAAIFNIDAEQLAADYKTGQPAARELRQTGKAAELAFGYDERGIGSIKDSASFEQNPQRNFRIRLATPGEIAATEMINNAGKPLALPDDALLLDGHQASRSGRAHPLGVFAPLPPGPLNDIPEHVARKARHAMTAETIAKALGGRAARPAAWMCGADGAPSSFTARSSPATGMARRSGLKAKATLSERGDALCETPPVAVTALLELETLPSVVWEPACGPGAIVSVLRAAGHIATDLNDWGCPDRISWCRHR